MTTQTQTNLKPFMTSTTDNVVIYRVGLKANGMGFLKTSEGLCYVNQDGHTFLLNGKKYDLFNFKVV